uniref:Small RNA 2'-O-methyltransferase n=1 Tax=Angiostrongylus cantonensis TaxID=6313 RepID=A0A158PA05_ANGCA
MDSSFCFPDDVYAMHHDFDRILHSYETIYRDIEANPIEMKIKQADFIERDHYEVVSKPAFFTPPLQHQRNEFVRNKIECHMERTGEKFRKLAVLGCGSLSLERFLMTSLGGMGIERVLSVDIDKHELAKGLKLLSVEHIPKADATRFVRSVLLNVQPELFIISTPNHDYNEAFGLSHGQFRHDDHKFEFSRQGFRLWLHGIISEFASLYDYEVDYVGNVLIDHKLFIILFDLFLELLISFNVKFSLHIKAGQAVLKNSLFILERETIKQGFILWLQNNKLLRDHLIQSPFGKFWRVDVDEVMQNVKLPAQLKSQLDKRTIV